MRIWILNHYAAPPDQPAGTRHYDFGRVLAAQGHDVTIFASSFSHLSRQEEHLRPGERLRVEMIDGVRFVWIRTTSYTGNDHRRARNMMSYVLGVLLGPAPLPAAGRDCRLLSTLGRGRGRVPDRPDPPGAFRVRGAGPVAQDPD